MTTIFKRLSLLTLIVGFFINSGLAQLSKDAAEYGSHKLEEKKNDIELDTLKAARRNIEKQYRKMEIAQQNVDIQMLLSLTHQDYKAYTSSGEVWDYKKLEMYWTEGLKQVVSTEALENNIKSFTLNKDTAVVLINQVWKRKQWMAGKIREVSTDAYQTETWIHTTDGWKRWKIENVSNKGALVDGKRVDITKPYDPDAPEYKPVKEK
jgi:hypothetical protein